MVPAVATIFLAICSISYATVFKDDCVHIHNEFRLLHENTPLLSYDDDLAAQAQTHADYLASTKTKVHSQTPGVGENIHQARRFYDVKINECSHATRFWYYKGIQWYDFNNPEFIGIHMVDHATQVVWVGTLTVGCGEAHYIQEGAFISIVVCQYTPAGNVLGQFAENVKPLKPVDPVKTTKKGVVVSYENYRCDDLTKLTGITSWLTKGIKMPTAVDGPCSDLPVQEHVSMLPGKFGHNNVGDRIPDGTNYLIGPLEPNWEFGASLTGLQAAKRFKDMEASLDAAGRSDVKIVSPSIRLCLSSDGDQGCLTDNPFDWYDDFFNNCAELNCNIYALAVHHHDCDPAVAMLEFVERFYYRYGYKIWLTSYPCPSATPEETIEYMRYMIQVVESAQYGPFVEKYFWNGTRPSGDGEKSNQLLEDNSSDLTVVGAYWNSFMDKTATFFDA